MNTISVAQSIEILLSPKKSQLLSLNQWGQLIFIFREAEVLARFYYRSTQAHCFESFPGKVQQHLLSAKIKAERQAKQAIFEAKELNKILRSIGITPIFLKGVAYTLSNKPVSQGRTYSDMDVLVPKEKLKTIERKLTMYGWFGQKNSDYDQKYYRNWAHEIPPLFQASRGTVADIHHNLIPPVSGKAPNIEIFTQSLQTVAGELTTLSQAGLVMHSIIHLFFNEEFSHAFRDITDLHIMFNEEIDNHDFWSELFELSLASKFTLELYLAIRYCQMLTKTEFPESFLVQIERLKPGKIKLICLDFIFSNALKPNHSSFTNSPNKLAILAGIIRGHLIKMPLHILLYHTIHKAIAGLFEQTNKKPV